MAFPGEDELVTLITPVTDSCGLDIEGIKVTRAGRKSVVSIRVDSDSRPDLDLLEAVSQEVSARLDAAEERGEVNLGAGYTLEVSTPGVDAPLTLPRHWRRNRNRLVELLEDGQKSVWRVGALAPGEDSVVLVRPVKKGCEMRVLEFSENPRAVVEIEFATPPAAETELTGLDYDQALAWQEENK
ncbi:ribosome maturation factor RimP [Corynebacterium hylobatis]|uniref:Ribosome maturation factor RimP n=1 Tax=Corynebacterium hylobatis TaxID=1859290 RepID=A0A430HVY5_9CORY|nr:ribosome maturation factor RimP [Corynebacterium hylobatis]RSZ61758.1 ribosome maturation factor RimP [Corynebacterium hylobatis]